MESIVVIGGGLMGSSTAWELSKAGERVLLLEQQTSQYSNGSSFGETRISRVLGEKDDIFSFIQKTAVALGKELMDFLNTSTGDSTHSMEDIYTTSPVTYLYYFLEDAEAQALIDGQDIQTIYAANSQMAREKFTMTIPEFMQVIREYAPYSGTLNPGALIRKLHEAIVKSGGRIAYATKVIRVCREKNYYRLTLLNTLTGETESMCCKKAISAAGPYTGQLLKDIAPGFSKLIKPRRLSLAFFNIDAQAFSRLSDDEKTRLKEAYPVIDISFEIFYSMIEKYEDGTPILKVGGHLLRTDISDLDRVWDKKLTEQEISWSLRNTLRYLSMLNIPLDASALRFCNGYSCVYSLTESEVPYVTRIADPDGNEDPNFVVVGGMSGIGAKGSLAYGHLAANTLLGLSDNSEMYQKTQNALGFERLLEDLSARRD